MSCLIVFDTWADFACFKKIGTTMTSLTFQFMPRSAAEGIIGAILGYRFEESPEKLGSARIAIQARTENVTKMPFQVTYVDTKEAWRKFWSYIKMVYDKATPSGSKSVEFHTRVRMEFLRNPYYRIYFDIDDGKIKELLENRLKKHEAFFIPYLGSSSMLANFSYVGSFDYETIKSKEPVPISSVVPYQDRIPKIQLLKDTIFVVEQNLPIHLTAKRELVGTYNAVLGLRGCKLMISDLAVQKVRTSKEEATFIVFLPTEIASR